MISITNFSNCLTCFSGYFHRGEINKPYLINNLNEFKHTLGHTDNSNYNDWYQIYNFLQYSSNLLVTRAVDETKDLFNSYVSFPHIDTDTLVYNIDDFTSRQAFLINPENKLKIIAKTPGNWGDKLCIGIFTNLEHQNNAYIYKQIRAKDIVKSMDDGQYTLVVFYNNTIVEVFTEDYDSLNNINNNSNYIYIIDKLSSYETIDGNIIYADGSYSYADGNAGGFNPVFLGDSVLKLSGGISYAPTEDQLQISYDIFNSKEDYNLDIIICNSRNSQAGVDLANNREDCIAITNILPEKCSEYVYITNNYKKQFDLSINDYRWIDFNGDIAGIRAQSITKETNFTNIPIQNCYDTKYKLTKSQIDLLYKQSINYVYKENIKTDRLFVNKQSSLDNFTNKFKINKLIREITNISRNFIHEEINSYNINRLQILLRRYLVTVKYNRTIKNYKLFVNGFNIILIVQPNNLTKFVRLQITNNSTEIKLASLI